MKPIIKGKRYFNSTKESVWSKIFCVLRSFFYIIFLELTRKRKPFFSKDFDIKKWTVDKPDFSSMAAPAAAWLGHATFLLKLNDLTILTDPVLSDLSFLYPRMVPTPLPEQSLPNIDVIVISHNHMDHFDVTTLRHLVSDDCLVLVPRGDAVHAKKLGFTNVQECQWHEQVQHKGVEFTFLPADHWSGTHLFNINKSLWGSWMMQAAQKKIYFAGDTKYAKHFSYIGQHHANIDVALMPIGPLHPKMFMQNAHIDVEQALQAFVELKAKKFIPMHWGTFRPANDTFNEPIELLQQLWKCDTTLTNSVLYVPKFGETFELD